MPRNRGQKADDAEQKQIPGLETPRNERVHKAAKSYYSAMQSRKAELEIEVAAKATLIRIMQEEGLDTYKFKDVSVTLTEETNVKVKVTPPGEAEEE